jgi:monoamine oxidase
MARAPWFRHLQRIVQAAEWAERKQVSSAEALGMMQANAATRRQILAGAGAVAAAGALGAARPAFALPSPKSSASIAIVGGGLAGLACLDDLVGYGLSPTLYESGARTGGRCWSMGGSFSGPVSFPGQVVERGGELIDNLHKAMLGYAKRFKLTLEDYEKDPDEQAYYVGGTAYSEADVIDEYRDLTYAMGDDLRKIGAPTALAFTKDDESYDTTDLATYLTDVGAGSLITKVIEAAYVGEYGLEIDEQTCLAFLLFAHADRRSKFRPFGVFSDERYHLVDGNERIPQELAKANASYIQTGHRLVALADRSGGGYTLTLDAGGRTVSKTADMVVLSLPFSALRDVDTSKLTLSALKRRAISELVYGTNSKQMVGFTSRPWRTAGFKGAIYGDLPNCTVTWETNPTQATSARGVLTDYSGGDRGRRIDPTKPDTEARAFLGDLDKVFPGAKAAARTAGGKVVAHVENWSKLRDFKGSYTANHVGYFTRVADLEGLPDGQIYFAGEHTSSFYEWQGFMEGACLSGQRAAAEVVAALK